jgi:hypothetical protein
MNADVRADFDYADLVQDGMQETSFVRMRGVPDPTCGSRRC